MPQSLVLYTGANWTNVCTGNNTLLRCMPTLEEEIIPQGASFNTEYCISPTLCCTVHQRACISKSHAPRTTLPAHSVLFLKSYLIIHTPAGLSTHTAKLCQLTIHSTPTGQQQLSTMPRCAPCHSTQWLAAGRHITAQASFFTYMPMSGSQLMLTNNAGQSKRQHTTLHTNTFHCASSPVLAT